MCTVVILRRPGHDWPLIFAANRDEMTGRPWLAPGRHWSGRAEVVAGRDELAGGTWLGLNDWGVVAGVLNRPGSLGPDPALRSRGELPLDALEHAEAAVAADAMAAIRPESYRSFNLVIADSAQAFWIKSDGGAGGVGGGAVSAAAIPEGVSMITAHDINDTASPRIRRFLPQFEAAAEPDPETGDWAAWQALMGETDGTGEESEGAVGEGGPNSGGGNDRGAMTIAPDVTGSGGFATVSSSLIALPAPGRPGVKPRWLFAPGRPDETPYGAVEF